jgi:hypothetical protein
MRRVMNKNTRMDTQIKFCKTMAIPSLTCNSETWTLKKKSRGKDRHNRNKVS